MRQVKGKGKGKGKDLDSSLFLERVKSPWKVGAHVSAAGGVENAVTNAITIGFVTAGFLLNRLRKIALIL